MLVILGVVLGLYFGLQNKDVPHTGAVVANGFECAQIGSDILRRSGNVADAAIATLFCEGISCPQSMGLGGGFFLTIYKKDTGKVESLVAREVAPKAADENMFVNETSVQGPKAIAVPGELKGYWELHKRYGKLSWAELVQPSIELCRTGHVVTGYLSRILKTREELIKSTPSLREIYVNPATDEVWNQGELIRRPKLGDTLEIIAREGVDTIYNNGTIAQLLLKDLQEMGSIITLEDFLEYRVRWQSPEVSQLVNNLTMYTSPLPGTGVLVTFIMNILNGLLPDQTVQSFHRITEAFKFAYAKRTDFGDLSPGMADLIQTLLNPSYVEDIRNQINDDQTSNDYKHYGATYSLEDDHGTAHINILAPNGDAIAATSTINNIFGSKIRSVSTGIILNDEMDDFSTPGKRNSYGVPASPANFIVPGKMPLSSMCPIIIVDRDGNVQLLIGGAGGIKITSSVAYTIIRHLYFNESLQDAVHAPRIHHQLLPMQIDYEQNFDPALLTGLAAKGHDLFQSPPDSGFASLTAIAREGDKISAVFDPRRQGSAVIFEGTL